MSDTQWWEPKVTEQGPDWLCDNEGDWQDVAVALWDEIQRLRADNASLRQSVERLEGDAQGFHRVVALLQDAMLAHGKCIPREDRACTHCNAIDDLTKLVMGYRGPRVVQSTSGGPGGSE